MIKNQSKLSSLTLPLTMISLIGISTAQAQYEQPPPEVDVQIVSPGRLPVLYEYSGRISASRSVEVRARVGGILLERMFDEGGKVSQGDPLYRLDPALFQAEVNRARAELQRAEAQLAQARRTESRNVTLREQSSVSQAALDDAISARELADADVAAASAALRTASLSLDYALVRAPESGTTDLTEVTEGSLIAAGDLLTTIDQLSPIHVDFAVADTEAVKLRRIRQEANLDEPANESRLSVSLVFGDGSEYSKPGRIDFTGATIDRETGTRRARAVIDNPDTELTPGQFVRVRLEGLSVDGATELPAVALSQGPEGTYVFRVDDEGNAQASPIDVGWYNGKTIIVTGGLTAGDRIITTSLTKVRNGAPVTVADSSDDGESGKASDDTASGGAE